MILAPLFHSFRNNRLNPPLLAPPLPAMPSTASTSSGNSAVGAIVGVVAVSVVLFSAPAIIFA
ncbi:BRASSINOSTEROID INSENSITIVE 1-associated receptor kinase 1-like [Gossypium australe]|uniref:BRASSINOSTEROID INSENSITIVE 1-associated receptor kinase 1-like n=1 Tax=Gossypium australe TaxID=47621 RepID=A0A5B6X5H2_9ROSI|nr:BRASSINOSTEROID INSENSITIVE 1-associated receptor kinase 1-like [Gossypium australe]